MMTSTTTPATPSLTFAPTRARSAAQPELVLCELGTTGLPGLESYSPFCLKTHRALVAAGLTYTSRHAGRPAEHRPLNPAAQVPVLVVDGRPVADSTAILRELLHLRPGCLAATAEDWLWEELADTALNGFLVAARWADPRSWPQVKAAYFSAMPPPVRAIVPGLLRRNVVKALNARDVLRRRPRRLLGALLAPPRSPRGTRPRGRLLDGREALRRRRGPVRAAPQPAHAAHPVAGRRGRETRPAHPLARSRRPGHAPRILRL